MLFNKQILSPALAASTKAQTIFLLVEMDAERRDWCFLSWFEKSSAFGDKCYRPLCVLVGWRKNCDGPILVFSSVCVIPRDPNSPRPLLGAMVYWCGIFFSGSLEDTELWSSWECWLWSPTLQKGTTFKEKTTWTFIALKVNLWEKMKGNF